jgi:hypothetical protein
MKYRIVALTVLGLLSLGVRPGEGIAGPLGASAERHAAASSDVSSQRRRLRRPPVRITVYPRTVVRSGLRIDLFPRPYPYEWPGPFARRDCVGWLAPELRPSGRVIVPHRRCWWSPWYGQL